jgi:hypothetical protein
MFAAEGYRRQRAGIMSATAQAAATITVVTIQMLKRGTILPNL